MEKSEYNLVILRYGLDTESVPFTPLGKVRSEGVLLRFNKVAENLDITPAVATRRLKKIFKEMAKVLPAQEMNTSSTD